MSNQAHHFFEECCRKELSELQRRLENIDAESIEQACEIILNCTGKLIVSGAGKSGLIGRKLAATFSSTGTPAFFLHPADALHGDLGAAAPGDVMLLLTRSGESEELISMLGVLERMEIPIISILGRAKSSVGRMSKVIIDAGVEHEADALDLAPTASSTVALVLGDALASATAQLRGFQKENFALFHPGGQLGKRLSFKVEDFLVPERKVPAVNIHSDMRELLELSTESNLGAVLVTNGDGTLKGIVTDGDIRRAIIKYGNILERDIPTIMTADPICVHVDTSAVDALKLMEDRPSQISVLPVIDRENRPLGLLRLHDIVRAGL